ncbi:hypothetical protein FQN57_004602 [Myotisia sp. PD_48]|nr:hypothetical protein FQN57_004602 [Myotisia sp. PD_48]
MKLTSIFALILSSLSPPTAARAKNEPAPCTEWIDIDIPPSREWVATPKLKGAPIGISRIRFFDQDPDPPNNPEYNITIDINYKQHGVRVLYFKDQRGNELAFWGVWEDGIHSMKFQCATNPKLTGVRPRFF